MSDSDYYTDLTHLQQCLCDIYILHNQRLWTRGSEMTARNLEHVDEC